MKKALLIGVIVCVLALGGIGAAYATHLDFLDVGALSLGSTAVDDINVDFFGYEFGTGTNLPVVVDGVYISFEEDLHASFNSVVIFVSLRDGAFQELAYCVATVPASTTLNKNTIYKFRTADNTEANPEEVYYVKVTVGENSSYSFDGHVTEYGDGDGWVWMPGQD